MYIFENKHYIPLKNDSWKTASSLGWSLLNGYVTFLRCATCFFGKHSNPNTDIIDSMIIAFFKWKMKSTFAPTHTYQKNNAFSCVNNLKFRNMAKIDVNFFYLKTQESMYPPLKHDMWGGNQVDNFPSFAFCTNDFFAPPKHMTHQFLEALGWKHEVANFV